MRAKTVLVFVILSIASVVTVIAALLLMNSDSYRFEKLSARELGVRIDSGESFIAVFTQRGCGACEAAKPLLADDQLVNHRRIYEIDVTSDPDIGVLSDVYALETTPTFLFVSNGMIQLRKEGVPTPEEYAAGVSLLE